MSPMRFLLCCVFCLLSAQESMAQAVPTPRGYDVPLAPIHGVPLSQSLPRLVAEGWQIVGVSLRDRTFAYHLVQQGELVLCLSDLGGISPGTECMRLMDGAASGGPPPR